MAGSVFQNAVMRAVMGRRQNGAQSKCKHSRARARTQTPTQVASTLYAASSKCLGFTVQICRCYLGNTGVREVDI